MSFLMAPIFAKGFNMLGLVDPTTHSYLGVSVVVAGIGFLIWIFWQKDFRTFQGDRIAQSVFLFFGPPLLCFFTNLWWSHIGKWNLWGAGDDWTSYQYFARKIVVDGEWLSAGEGVFTMQPLYRYFVGIYHLLFGQSAFVQHMADVWCVLGCALLIVRFATIFRISSLFSFIAATGYLVINLVGSFRYHIGRGLVENHAMIFMMLAAWFLCESRKGSGHRIILATLFGILGYWTRQDHLGAIAGLAFLALEPVEGTTGGWKGYWGRFKIQWKVFAWYWGGGISSVLLICYRNWWIGGQFHPTNSSNPIFSISEGMQSTLIPALNHMLLDDKWPIPALSSIVLIAGTLIPLIALVWRSKVFAEFPLSFGIILVGLFAPYVFLWNGGYAPRFSIHLLPIAILSLTLFLGYIFKDFKIFQKFYVKYN
jgi:hypothetical protein